MEADSKELSFDEKQRLFLDSIKDSLNNGEIATLSKLDAYVRASIAALYPEVKQHDDNVMLQGLLEESERLPFQGNHSYVLQNPGSSSTDAWAMDYMHYRAAQSIRAKVMSKMLNEKED